MPFLASDELADHVGQSLAQQLVPAAEPEVFTAAEAAAAQRVTAITDVEAPDDPAAAPTWAKGPVAALVTHTLSGQVNWSDERRQWVAEMKNDALDALRLQAQRIENSPDDPTFGTVAPLDDIISY